MEDKIERLITRECFVLLGFLIIFFVSVFFMDDPIFEKLYFLSFYGYPPYLLIRIIIWAIKATMKNEP